MFRIIAAVIICLVSGLPGFCAYGNIVDKWQLPSDELFKMGIAYRGEHPDSAMMCYSIIEGRYSPNMSEEDIRLCVDALISKWIINFYDYYDYASAYECLIKAREIADENKMTLPNLDLQQGVINQVIGEQTGNKASLDSAYAYYAGGMRNAMKMKDVVTIDVLASNLLWQAWQTDRLDSIDSLWKDYAATQEIGRLPERKFIYGYNIQLYNSLSCLMRKDYDRCIELFDSMYYVSPDGRGAIRYRIIPLVYKSMAMSDKKDYAGAADVLENVLEIIDSMPMKDVLIEVYGRLSKCYAGMGRTLDALEYENKGLKLRDSLVSYSQLSRLDEIRTGRDVRKFRARLEDMENQRRSERMAIAVVVAFLLMLSVFFIILYNRHRKLKDSNRELYNRNVEILRQSEKEQEARKMFERRLEEVTNSSNAEKEEKCSEEKYKNSRLDDAGKSELIESVLGAMASTDEYLQPDFSIERLSELAGSRSKLVSQVINEKQGCNFNAFVNEFRIREACRRINDVERYGNLTLDAISKSVGFRARSSFFTAFKNVTGLTPSEFQKIARSERGK